MINQILDLTKISGGRYELNRQPLDVGGVIWNSKDRFADAAYKKSITLHIEDVPQGLRIDGDETAVAAILNHLVENAVTFTQNGGEVWIKASTYEDRVLITVADNGPGVRGDELERILEPFEQGGRSTHDHPEGAGLGLTLVKAFCELHGGSLMLKSESGEGFTAIIDLPRAE